MKSNNEVIEYIEATFDRKHGDSFWIDENGNSHGADVGYSWEWWNDCMRPELMRVFGKKEKHMLEFILKDNKKLKLENKENSLNAKLYTEDGIYMGEINWDINKITDMLFTE